MSKLTNTERDKLDNTCGNLRVTKLGTHVKSLEDFVNEGPLSTRANDVTAAINELYSMIVNNDCTSIQVPPPGFFTLFGNDEDGKLYCYYNDEDHPPVFRHVETAGEDEGTLYLYIADPEGDNHYELEIGHYIAVRHLEDYYTKTEIQNGYAVKSHTHGNLQSDGKVGTSNNASKNVVTDANGKITTEEKYTHPSTKQCNASIPSANTTASNIKVNGTQSAGTLSSYAKADHVHPTDTSRASNDHTHDDLATIAYVDGQIASIDGGVDIDLSSKADVNHGHGQIDKDGKVGTTANKPLITGTGGAVTAGEFGTGTNNFARGNHTHTGSDLRLGSSGSDANVNIQDAINAKAPSSHTDSKASTSDYGHTKLSNATDSSSEELAATPKAVKAAYDLANGKPNLGTSATTAAKGNHNHSGTYVDGVGDKNGTDGSALAEIKANTTVKGTIYHPKVLSSAVSSSLKKISVNTDGHITGTADVAASDLPSNIPTSKISGLDTALAGKLTKESIASKTLTLVNSQHMGGTVTNYKKHGWAIVKWSELQCSIKTHNDSDGSGWTPVATLEYANEAGIIYEDFHITESPAVAIRITSNQLQIHTYDTDNNRVFGYIMYPTSS